ncbi:MAG: hypothetical protein L0177_05545, partial [Chloroflexi bacterium]|nr:hypothetical protein [Chloroflexota bacterium]
MPAANRAHYPNIEGADELFTPEFLEYVVAACDRFSPMIRELRLKRQAMLQRALKEGKPPTFLPKSEANTGDWKVPPVPEDLKRPGIEISGPVAITNMAINALNPGPEGERAEGYLDDDEDSAGHSLQDTLMAARNRLAATRRTLRFHSPERNRTYEVEEGELPFFMHRERGVHLDEPDFTVDGEPIPAAILGTALTLFHVG